MAISGSLEDVAVADVLQFVYLGKRTGTLELERGEERARFTFHEGTLVGAQAPGAPRLGDLLVEEGHLSAGELEQSVRHLKLLFELESSDDFFVIDNVSLAESGQAGDPLAVALEVSTYFRGARSAAPTGSDGR